MFTCTKWKEGVSWGGGGGCRAVEGGGQGGYVQFSGDGGQVKRAFFFFFYILTRGKNRVKYVVDISLRRGEGWRKEMGF